MRGIRKFSNKIFLALTLLVLVFVTIVFSSPLIKAPGSIGDTCSGTNPITFSVTPSDGIAPLTITSSANAVGWIACVCQAYGQSATGTSWGLTFGDGGGDWTYGPTYQGYVSGNHTYNSAGSYSAGYSLEVVCAADTNTEITSGSTTITVTASAPNDSMNVTTPSGASSLTEGDSGTYNSTFTWTGTSATTKINRYQKITIDGQPVTVEAGGCSSSPSTSPNSVSCIFSFSTAGSYDVCAEGTSGSASDSKCVGVNVSSAPSASGNILISSPASGSALTAGTSSTISWTSEEVNSVNISYPGGSSSGVDSSNGGGSITWTVPNSPGAASVTVTDSSNSSVSDTNSFTIVDPNASGGDCTINSASWSKSSATEGATVNARVGTTNCVGKTILFDVWDSNNNPATTNPNSKIVTADGITSSGWTAEWSSTGTNQYYFKATISGTGTVTSANPKLNVSQAAAFCDSIVTCADYSDQASCESDSTTCNVASNSVPQGTNCNDPDVTCSCSWDSGTNTCSGAVTGPNPGCGDGIIQAGEQCDGTNFGTTITGCSNFDSFTDGTLSCNVLTCQFDTTQCTGGNGVGVCGDNIVNIGETCDGDAVSGDWGPITSCNDFDSFTGGILDCNLSTCQFDTTQCSGGESGIEGVGKCIYTQQSTGDTCDDGFLSLSWTANWIWDPSNPTHIDPQNLQAKCVDGSKTVECPAQIALPFFGTYNIIAALVVVGLVYWVLSVRGKRHSGKSRRK